MNEYIETNRRHWDELVGFHLRATNTYDVDAFKRGRSTLMAVERAEVGDVGGQTLLHLQCHFGMDTLSWARDGAIVTGVDFSPEAIKVAHLLAEELAIDARFIESDIYELPRNLNGAFDVVFASYGVLCWLPDFPAWARVAAGFLKPGGLFYLIDDHPISQALAGDFAGDVIRLSGPYFAAAGATMAEDDGSYADPTARLVNRRTYEFNHELGQVVSSLVDSGLEIEFLHEFPFAAWQRLPSLQQGSDGYWRLPVADSLKLPFLFSVRARKPS